MTQYFRVGSVGDFPDGQLKGRIVDGENIAVVNAAGRLRAFSMFCTHVRVSLVGSFLEDDGLVCWLHYSVFDLETGEVKGGPAQRPLAVYDVRIEGEDVLVGKE